MNILNKIYLFCNLFFKNIETIILNIMEYPMILIFFCTYIIFCVLFFKFATNKVNSYKKTTSTKSSSTPSSTCESVLSKNNIKKNIVRGIVAFDLSLNKN